MCMHAGIFVRACLCACVHVFACMFMCACVSHVQYVCALMYVCVHMCLSVCKHTVCVCVMEIQLYPLCLQIYHYFVSVLFQTKENDMNQHCEYSIV